VSNRGDGGRSRLGFVAALLTTGLFLLAAPSFASAAQVVTGTYTDPLYGFSAGSVIYTAGTGEANDLSVTQSVSTITITDAGVTTISDPNPADACAVDSIVTNKITCTDATQTAACWDPANPDGRTIGHIELTLGDGDDQATIDDTVTPDTIMRGDDGNDVLTGGKCASTEISGGAGNDELIGGAGTDFLSGGAGDDVVHPGEGSDFDIYGLGGGSFLLGGSGFDTLSYSELTTPVRIDLTIAVSAAGPTTGQCHLHGSGAEFVQDQIDQIDISPSNQFERLVGTSGDDCIEGSRLDNEIDGGPGADQISGNFGRDTIDYRGKSQAVNVTLGNAAANQPGDDGVPDEHDNIIEDVENVLGTAGDDTLIGHDRVPAGGQPPDRGGYEGQNILEGRGGNDFFDGKGDADAFIGGDGTDTVTYAGRTTSVVGTIGQGKDDGGTEDIDNLTAASDSKRSDDIRADIEHVIGGSGADVLRGDDGNNTGDNGDDILEGGAGDDSINGGAGVDSINGGAGNDLLEGAAGSDTLISGGDGDDDLEGGDGNDTLSGDGGQDLLDGNSGSDNLNGGGDFDAADYSSRLTPVSASADDVPGDGESGEGDNIASDVEDLYGGADDDTLVGNGGDGILDGAGGDDSLDGGPGADDLIGGAGADRATYAGRAAPLFMDLTTLGGDGEVNENDDIAGDVEKVTGGSGNDTLIGNAGSNLLFGGEGADTINGGDGFDLLHGDGGADNLNGAGGTDLMFGDAGNDTLLGGSENDTLSGGDNDDSLDGATGADVINGNAGTDTANYAARTAAVNITLDGAPNDGQSGENDLVKHDVESVSTGSGNDTVNSVDGLTGKISCGRGTDTVTASDKTDSISSDCEKKGIVALARCSISRSAKVKGRVLSLRVTCPAAGKGTVTVRGAGARLGKKSFKARAGKRKTVKVKMSKKGRRALKKNKRLRLRVTVSSIRSGKVKTGNGSKRTITIRVKGKR
jgi:Ca2+-binding RTX toxin-like protein